MNKNVKINNPMKVITGPDTRWSYANVWEPKSINGGTPKYSVSLTEDELPPLVDAWRQSNPHIVQFWRDVDHAVTEAVKYKHTTNGIVPQYYVEGNHEAIIPKDIFLRVQEELVRRRVVKTSANGKKLSYSCNHCFAQIVICGKCGEMFRRIHWNNHGCKSIVWRCISRLEPTGQECHARTVNETVLENVVVQAINTLLGDKSTYQAQLQQNIAKVIRSAQQNTADGIDERLQELQKELLKKANNKEAYDEIADEIFKLREQREKFTVDTAARDAQIARINELQDFIKQQPAHLEAFDESLVKRWLERIIIWDDHFTVELKSGLKIEIDE